MKMWASKKGFTIIELLISIVVIGILASITIVSYSGIQKTSRDSERGSDVVALKIAIEKYYAENSKYPGACSGGDDTECAIGSLATLLAPYVVSIPHDPRNVADSPTDYRYIRGATASPSEPSSFGIKISYESKAVCKTGSNTKTAWWTSAVPNC
jgi:prepilin-type N-terminal cleavage/methylation domain-containing protein